jgi:mono/diheme cytochrome c family protein
MRASVLASLSAAVLIAGMFLVARDTRAQGGAGSKDAAMVHVGQQVFLQKCLQCHTVNEGQVSFGPNLKGEMAPAHPRKSSAEIRAILRDGKGKMPPFKDKLTAQETDAVMAYLHTL